MEKAILSIVEEVPGWMTVEELEFLANEVERLPYRSVVVEIGTFAGRSTIVLAHTGHVRVITIDNWSGAKTPEVFYPINKEVFISNCLRVGISPMEYTSFYNCESGLYYMDCDSAYAYNFFPDNSIDFWFHDGDHDTVGRDIDNWNRKFKRTAILCGHDFHYGFSVKADVEARMSINEVHGTIWVKRGI